MEAWLTQAGGLPELWTASCYDGTAEYPGLAPREPFLIADQRCCRLRLGRDPSLTRFVAAPPGGPPLLEEWLIQKGHAALGERYCVLAFGGNRNPGNLRWKLRHMGVVAALVGVPVRLVGADVVAVNLSYAGYFYGDLLFDDPMVSRSSIQALMLLVDLPTLRALHATEEVPAEHVLQSGARFVGCRLAHLPSVSVCSPWGPVGNALAYVSWSTVFVPPALGAPMAYAAVRGYHTLRAYTQSQMLRTLDAMGVVSVDDVPQRLRLYWERKLLNTVDTQGEDLHRSLVAVVSSHVLRTPDGRPRTGIEAAAGHGCLLSAPATWNPGSEYTLVHAFAGREVEGSSAP